MFWLVSGSLLAATLGSLVLFRIRRQRSALTLVLWASFCVFTIGSGGDSLETYWLFHAPFRLTDFTLDAPVVIVVLLALMLAYVGGGFLWDHSLPPQTPEEKAKSAQNLENSLRDIGGHFKAQATALHDTEDHSQQKHL